MRVISFRALREFWQQPGREDAESALRAWHTTVRKADWKTPADVRATFNSADFVAGNRVVYDIRGNKYRLIAVVKYNTGFVYLRWVGLHRDYDGIDVAKV